MEGLRLKLGTGASIVMLGVLAQQASAQELRFWTTEEQPERLAKQEALAAAFKDETGIAVEVIPVTETDLGTRTTAAFAAGDLPDVIYHTLQYVQPWAEAGILDWDAATEVIEALGPDTFAPRPPEMYGFVAATKVDENFMSQVLEHVFLVNGVSPVSAEGDARLDEATTVEVLRFYVTLVEASPPGDLYWQQSRELYFAGKAAMIIWSPFILDELAGLRDSAPVTISDDPTSRELAEKTGIITTFSGPSNPDGAAWADIRYFGITNDAATDDAIAFVEYSMGEGYMQTLSIAPEGKFPVRRGTADSPTEFVDAWSELPVGVDRQAALAEIYPKDVIDEVVGGLEGADRWGVAEGQLSLASKIINSQVLNRLVREYVDGERSAGETVELMNQELARIADS